jgi:hypothetical protein
MSSEMISFGQNCVITGVYYSVRVNKDDLDRYKRREGLAQDIFHYLDSGDREFIISGISPMGWKTIYPD